MRVGVYVRVEVYGGWDVCEGGGVYVRMVCVCI